ncbi:hypothetical protein PUNSTDRAFT_131902 [Punctularia strigosozonata HHB-11173 SS5]|uniref:uncharacterized protein n=1 Tax=Punctularia strigosozonata (strain HHB-11173) TaxID=741275 RepID=UPI000441674E|nr:uncharacterized protein PUNSTDRAFT_131902 [Punctularia strigosozonata HHB-11173 SS5]EIN11747.1 hypothetical protein PUNSTDRAFT_131902 [Punctularia strigosozonata HHB-11173 SS5]
MSTNETSILTVPYIIWRWYLDTLVYYDPQSWVASVAHAFRILAFVLIAPFAILTMLDVTSYVIARTLGVIETTKASTSDKAEMHETSVPTLLVSDESNNSTALDTGTPPASRPGSTDHDGHNATDPNTLFFNSGEKLSGVGVFSPAASRPASPTVERKRLVDTPWQNSLGASGSESGSVSESFTLIEKDEEDEGVSVGLRRRAQQIASKSASQ